MSIPSNNSFNSSTESSLFIFDWLIWFFSFTKEVIVSSIDSFSFRKEVKLSFSFLRLDAPYFEIIFLSEIFNSPKDSLYFLMPDSNSVLIPNWSSLVLSEKSCTSDNTLFVLSMIPVPFPSSIYKLLMVSNESL